MRASKLGSSSTHSERGNAEFIVDLVLARAFSPSFSCVVLSDPAKCKTWPLCGHASAWWLCVSVPKELLFLYMQALAWRSQGTFA